MYAYCLPYSLNITNKSNKWLQKFPQSYILLYIWNVVVIIKTRQEKLLPLYLCSSSNSVGWDAPSVDESAGLWEIVTLVTVPSKNVDNSINV